MGITVRPTIWIFLCLHSTDNAARVSKALHELGFVEVTPEMMAIPKSMIRMGIAPTKLEVTNFIDGVTFGECFQQRIRVVLDGLTINLISLPDLRRNKNASKTSPTSRIYQKHKDAHHPKQRATRGQDYFKPPSSVLVTRDSKIRYKIKIGKLVSIAAAPSLPQAFGSLRSISARAT